MAICIFLAILSPAPRVLAQLPEGCTEYNSADGNSDGYYSLTFGTLYPGDANTIAGDFFGYRVIYADAGTGIDVVYYQVGGAFGGTLHTFNSPATYTVSVHTAGLSVNTINPSNLFFTALVCLPIPPTATPTLTNTPTSTPTPTPTEVIVVTMTPSPTPSPTPVDVGAQLVTISAINYNMLLWSIFIGTISAGLALLAFIRLRL